MYPDKWGDKRQRNDLGDYGNQLRFVTEGNLRAINPVNSEAYKVMVIIEKWVAAHYPGYRVFPEISLGTFIKADTDEAFKSISGKRSDFLVVDKFGGPFLVIEYNGTGHKLDRNKPEIARGRRRVKALALEKVNVPMAVIPSLPSADSIERILSETMNSVDLKLNTPSTSPLKHNEAA